MKKLSDAQKCPRCGAGLTAPTEEILDKGQKECGYCKLEIKWIKAWVAVDTPIRVV